MSLVLCTNCDRHIRHDETSCPFCDAAHTPLAISNEKRGGWIQPLSRAAIVFFGASAITAAASACDKEGAPPNTPTADSGTTTPAPTETAPKTPPASKTDGGTSSSSDTPPPSPHPMPVALYGVAPMNK